MMQTDPFRDLETLFSRVGGRQMNSSGVMPMDAFRRGSDVWVHIDLPGVKAENLDITVERNVLTIAADRNWQRQDGDQSYFGERYRGSFRRQIQLGDGLDLENLEADLHDGVLTDPHSGRRASQATPGRGRQGSRHVVRRNRSDQHRRLRRREKPVRPATRALAQHDLDLMGHAIVDERNAVVVTGQRLAVELG